jgi:surface polysaccharide O-acyltransferase-like enzyme
MATVQADMPVSKRLALPHADEARAVQSRTDAARIPWLDNLRSIAMLLGVFLHAAFAYASPSQSVWLATDARSSVLVDATIWFIHLFRMSLFFLLSGYFAKLVIQRKGVKQFLLNRSLRIALPLAIFYPFLLASFTAVFMFALSYLESPRGLMGLIAAAAKDATQDVNPPAPGTMHLWFLYYLLYFTLLTAALSQLKWLKFDWLFQRPILLTLAPLVLIPGVLGAGVPLPAPESFIPTWWPFAFYGVFYWAGWQLFGREGQLDRLSPHVWKLVAPSVLLFVAYYLSMPSLDLSLLLGQASATSPFSKLVAVVLTSYLSVSLTIASLLLGKRCLQNRNAVLSLLSDASYWTYLVHLPIALFLQTLLIPFALPVWLKLTLTILGTLVPCLASYLVFVRYTPLGWLLHGKRSFP